MPRPRPTTLLCLLACAPLFAACATDTGLTTVTETRVEKPVLDPASLTPCERAGEGAPNPDDPATRLRDVAIFLPVLAARLERCAARVDAIRKTLTEEP